ncbi:DUF1802 domain-containing protein [Tumidithrix helvetica PCC 7403]|uniref:DUF1802 family protein n=1 Tax=Tumidithrix helvetica TaxID=3457545 RepID=UPI003C8D0839
MTEATIFAALRLPSGVLSSLESGSITAIHAHSFNRPKQDFALCSDDPEASEVKISAWARCEGSQQFSEKDKCDILAARLQIPIESFQNALEQNGFIWLSYLRVYHLPSPIIIKNSTKGVFIALENRIYINELQPVLDDITYEKRKREVENLEPPEPLDIQIQKMLEAVEIQCKMESLKKLDWIKEITTKGNRSIEEDKSKSNYQAGTEFENIVKQSLEFLGFTVDITHKGGAGGLDLFCSKPYSVAGECKAGRSKSDKAVEQIDRIAKRILKENYLLASGLIILGSGDEPSNQLVDSAISSKVTGSIKINIIKAMTLQKLVKLKAKYDGAIDLFELKKYLQGGQIDEEIDKYIQKVEGEINLRSHIIQSVKELMNQPGEDYLNASAVRVQYNAIFGKDVNSILNDRATHELLVELSSPLAGYLGREKSNSNWRSDRFYFLRDLPIGKEI